jgi:hypothetical protein
LRTGRRGSLYVDPDHQRRDAMRLALDGVASECTYWLHQHFPGAFADGLLGGDHPTCVFLTTKVVVPFARPERLVKWLWVTGLDAAHDAWDSKDWPGLHLRVPERDRERHRWWLAGRRGDFLADSTDDHQAAYGGATRQGWLNRIDLDMSLTLMLHATDSLLLGMHEAVARSRDTMGARATRKWNVRRLEALRSNVTSFVRDVEPVASELSSPDWRVEERATFMPGPDNIFSVLRWSATSGGEVSGAPASTRRPIWSRLLMRIRSQVATPAEMPDPVAVPTLTTHLVDTIRHRARLLLEAERQHRDGIATVSTLVAAGESFRLDRRIFVLTLVLGVIAVVAALPSIANVLLVALRLLGLDLGTPSFGSAPSPSP